MDIRDFIIDPIANPKVVADRPIIGFYPSSASVEYTNSFGELTVVGGCLRAQYYSFAGVPAVDPPSNEAYLRMELGNWVGAAITEMFKRSNVHLGDEVRMFYPGPPPISGRVDNFIKNPTTGKPVGVEVKSIYGYQGEKGTIVSTRNVQLAPKPEAVLQVLPYLNHYIAASKGVVDEWIILYVGRGSGKMRCHSITMDKGAACISNEDGTQVLRHLNIDAIFKRWMDLLGYMEEQQLPPRDYALQYSNEHILNLKERGDLSKTDCAKVDRQLSKGSVDLPLLEKGDWRCTYCNHKSLCWGKEWDSSTMSSPGITPVIKANIVEAPTVETVNKTLELF